MEASEFSGYVENVRRTRSGWKARCPVCGTVGGLYFADAWDGFFLWCGSGCARERILQALGLSAEALQAGKG